MDIKISEIAKECEELNVENEGIINLLKRLNAYLANFSENTEGEMTNKEVIQEFLEFYKNENQADPKLQSKYFLFLQYKGLKKLLEIIEDPNQFKKLWNEALEKENNASQENLKIDVDLEKEIISTLRQFIRENNKKNPTYKEISDYLKENKSKLGRSTKDTFIQSIQKSISYLNEFGFLDEYIKMYNDKAKELGLEGLELVKQNPIPDEQYQDGKLVKDTEDIGVLDAYSSENLERLSLETLCIMDYYWKSRYYKEMQLMSIVMQIIDENNLWDELCIKDSNKINELDSEHLKKLITKFLITRKIALNNVEVTPELEEEYRKFLIDNGLQVSSLRDDVKDKEDEIKNNEMIRNQVAILEIINIIKLLQKDMNVKKYGILKDDQDSEDNHLTLAIEFSDFRGVMLVDICQQDLENFMRLAKKTGKLPEYDNDDGYIELTSIICMLENRYYKNKIKDLNKTYHTSTSAALAGKKPKPNSNPIGER